MLAASSAIATLTCQANPAVAVALQFNQSFGTSGAGSGQFNTPGGVAVDGSGNVYVADLSNHRIVNFNFSNPTGTFTSFGTVGSGNGQFNDPFRVAVDSIGNVYVADTGNNRIVQLSPVGAATSVPEPSEIVGTLFAGACAVAMRRRLRQRQRLVVENRLTVESR